MAKKQQVYDQKEKYLGLITSAPLDTGCNTPTVKTLYIMPKLESRCFVSIMNLCTEEYHDIS